MNLLIVNSGSSTLKLAVFRDEQADAIAEGDIDWQQEAPFLKVHTTNGDEKSISLEKQSYGEAMASAVSIFRELGIITEMERLSAVGHRFVHGGHSLTSMTRIDASVKKMLVEAEPLAPLHIPPALAALEGVEQALPDLPNFAVFDTAFHSTIPPSRHVYAVPYHWYTDWHIRRYGFHGISHDYCSTRGAELSNTRREQLRQVVCHLGNGCSATAVSYGKSIATSMGFTPLDGLMMGSRSGSVDPGILFFVQKSLGLSADDLDRILNKESGLLGISGISADFRQISQSAAEGNDRAKLALAIFEGRLRSTIASLVAEMNGIDTLIFTAGIGENSPWLRQTVCDNLSFLGIEIDSEKNKAPVLDAVVSTDASSCKVLVIHTRENLLIANEIRRMMS